MRKIRRKVPRPRPLKRQRDILCDVMLAAGACETRLTLVELSCLTHYGEASISAQLRHLRKPQYGGFVVEKRLAGSGGGSVQRGAWADLGVPVEPGDEESANFCECGQQRRRARCRDDGVLSG